jgi:polysaccharide export outer membrane protein
LPNSGSRSATALGSNPAPAGPRSTEDLIPAIIGIPDDARSRPGTHRLTPGDVVKINVFQAEELSTEERVTDDGTIVLPLVGAVAVAGLTSEQAETEIAAVLGKDYLQNPQVDVFVSEYANMKVSVGGEVKRPGVFGLTGQTTLLQAIAEAGGLTDVAKPQETIVFRQDPTGGDIKAYVVDLKQVQRGELSDPLLAGNDKVLVPKAGGRAVIKEFTNTAAKFISFRAITF